MSNDGLIIVTGAASGIGRAAAEALAQKSRPLALVDLNAEPLAQTVETCKKHSPGTAGFVCDVSSETAVNNAYQEISKRFGTPKILVNCAGVGRFAPFLDLAPAEWVQMFNVNVMGTVLFTRAVLADMLADGEGSIVNVGSRMALDPHAATTAYAATKAAIWGFSRALATEVSGKGIKVTYLAPGGTKTNLGTPKHNGYLEPEAIADAIVYITDNGGNAWVRDLVVLPLGF